MKAQSESTDIAPLSFFYLGAEWGGWLTEVLDKVHDPSKVVSYQQKYKGLVATKYRK